jgi:hypothetical protein
MFKYSMGFAFQYFISRIRFTCREVDVHLQSLSNLVVEGAVSLVSGSDHFIPWRKPLYIH